jgi:hypothetical protein
MLTLFVAETFDKELSGRVDVYIGLGSCPRVLGSLHKSARQS